MSGESERLARVEEKLNAVFQVVSESREESKGVFKDLYEKHNTMTVEFVKHVSNYKRDRAWLVGIFAGAWALLLALVERGH